MTARDEIDEMHLTPNGWVQGSQQVDFETWTHRQPPPGSLLTVKFREQMSANHSGTELTATESKHASDAEILAALQKHGTEFHSGANHYKGWPEFLKKIGYRMSEALDQGA
ncbi:hypothetical protein DM806_10955 [Sphingobium lactosutens]|uniref:hypothetical protein n=1 Tax=Sphingobium lactosutens TaxID=522773 RepID=UPI0015BCF1CB|nr:hypothetical protein [Sphingobium lactosutens]NWK96185.1 hypothetical protein [Sphingobium lactosutens]